MDYDPLMMYTTTYFKSLSPRELQILFEEAKKFVNQISDSKLIRKVNKDITAIRLLLTGFNSEYNKEHE